MRRLILISALAIFTILSGCDDSGTAGDEAMPLEFSTTGSQQLDQIVEETPGDFSWQFFNDNIQVRMNSEPRWDGEIVLSTFQVRDGEISNRTTSDPYQTGVDELADGISTETMYPGTKWYPTTRWISTEEWYPGTKWYPTTRWSPSEIESQATSLEKLAENQIMVVVYAQLAGDSPERDQSTQPMGLIFQRYQTGTLAVITETGGSDKDSDGYTFTVDGGNATDIGTADTAYVGGLDSGNHQVSLSGTASNCYLQSESTQNVNITARDTTSVTFNVQCEATANNEIAFVSDRDGDNEIYLMNADGSSPEKLTDNTARDSDPVISHDGTKIAFISDRNGSKNLYTMDADGSDVTQLTNSAAETFLPAWSPNDQMLAFSDARNTSDPGAIYVINADGSGEDRLTYLQALDSHPSWSADGDKIVFASDRGGNNDIYTMNPDGSGVQSITDDGNENFAPRYSPDGSRIAFVSRRSGSQDIYTMTASGSSLTQLTASAALDEEPSWSPDGSKIVFQTDRDGNQEIYKTNADGTGTMVNLTVDGANDLHPFWSPLN